MDSSPGSYRHAGVTRHPLASLAGGASNDRRLSCGLKEQRPTARSRALQRRTGRGSVLGQGVAFILCGRQSEYQRKHSSDRGSSTDNEGNTTYGHGNAPVAVPPDSASFRGAQGALKRNVSPRVPKSLSRSESGIALRPARGGALRTHATTAGIAETVRLQFALPASRQNTSRSPQQWPGSALGSAASAPSPLSSSEDILPGAQRGKHLDIALKRMAAEALRCVDYGRLAHPQEGIGLQFACDGRRDRR